MKRLPLYFSFFFFFLIAGTSTAQSSMERFFKYEGVKTLASLAHPSNIFKGGKYTVYSDYVLVDIYYKDGYKTRLRLNRYKDFFTGIDVLSDNDWFPPFAGIFLIKEVLYEVAQENTNRAQTGQIASAVERFVDKSIQEFNGEDLTLLVLNLEWFGY